jgi:hypothetical protein
MKVNTQAAASRIASRLNNGSFRATGISLDVILGLAEELIPVLIQCFKPDDGTQAQKYLQKRFNPDTKTFNKMLVRQTSRRVKTVAQRNGTLITFDAAEQIAQDTLLEALQMDPHALSVLIRENSR